MRSGQDMLERIKSFFRWRDFSEEPVRFSHSFSNGHGEKNFPTECPPPPFYFIDTCNVCNLKCRFCPTGKRESGMTKARMTLDQYRVIFDKIQPYAKQIHLYNWGEPFLNKDILPIISMTAAQGIYTELHSNLSMRDFSPAEAEAIVQSGLSLLSVSLDGNSQKTYSLYRVGGDFRRVFENIQKIVEARGRLRQRMVVRWNFLINVFNEQEVKDVQRMAADLGLITRFSLMGIEEDSWASSYHRDSSKALPKNVVLATHDDWSHCDASLRPEPVPLHPKLPGFCQQTFNWMTVNPNGDVMPCCTVYGDRYSVGNLLGPESLLEIWNGLMYRKCREFLLNYGTNQTTGAVCQTMPCNVGVKYFGGRDVVYADCTVHFLNGIWADSENGDWAWLSDVSCFTVTANRYGVLRFELVVPDSEMHKSTLPMKVEVCSHHQSLFSKIFECPGNYLVEMKIESGRDREISITCDKSVTPDQFFGNGDTRKLSLIIRKFTIR